MASTSSAWSSEHHSSRNFKSINDRNNKHFERPRGRCGGRGQGGLFNQSRGQGDIWRDNSGEAAVSWVEDRSATPSSYSNRRGSTKDLKASLNLALSDDDDEAGDNALKVNKNYANRYDRWRRLEEKAKIKARYGINADDADEDSSSTSEDEEGNRLPPEFDKEFLRALSCLKGKDPRIYDKRSQFFENLDITNLKDAHTSKPKPEKPVYLKDYERQMLLTNEEGLPNEEKDNEKLKQELFEGNRSYMEEQRQIKESFKQIVADSDEDGDLLTERKKTVEEVAKEDDSYYTWLKGQKPHLEEEQDEKEIGFLKEMWNQKSLPPDEKFLRDFIVDKKYLNQNKIDSEDAGFALDSSENEEVDEKMDQFENKFNFRFEEPDKEFIKSYPRLVTTSLRVKDEKRKEQRNKTRDRKIKKKDQKREELKRLKAMKRKEISEKLDKIKLITGNDKVGIEAADLDGDFDPEAHDLRMKQLFDDEYYDCNGAEADGDDEKPEFPPDEDDENWDEWQGPANQEIDKEGANHLPHCEDPDFNMDCEYNPKADFQEEMMNASRKKRRKLSKLAKALQRKKPVFDPQDSTFEQYLDEYYKLDYEDIIDDLPCRFKYRKVIENDFGLTVEEILSAEDRELNAWCSLKKTCQYRSEQEEMRDLDAYRQKGRSYWKKQKILKSVYAKNDEEEIPKEETLVTPEINENTKNRKKKKNTGKAADSHQEPQIETEKTPSRKQNSKKKLEKQLEVNKTRKSGKFGEQSGKKKRKSIDVGISDSRLKAFGINPKKYKSKLIYGRKDEKSQS